jgi:hypothetical protein
MRVHMRMLTIMHTQHDFDEFFVCATRLAALPAVRLLLAPTRVVTTATREIVAIQVREVKRSSLVDRVRVRVQACRAIRLFATGGQAALDAARVVGNGACLH